MISITEIQGHSELENWKSQWFDAFTSSNAVDLSASYHFLVGEYQQLNSDRNKQLLIAHNNDVLLGAMLYSKKEQYLFKNLLKFQYIQMGGHYVSDALLLGNEPEKVFYAFIRYLKRRYPKSSWFACDQLSVNQYQQVLKTKSTGSLVGQGDPVAIFNVSEGGKKTIKEKMKKKSRANINYCERLLHRNFDSVDMVVEVEFSSKEQNDVLFSRFIELEDSGWKQEEAGSILRRSGGLCFHQAVSNSASSVGQMCWSELIVDGKTIAMLFSVKNDRTVWVCKTAYDEGYKKYSPGAVLLTKFLEGMADQPSIDTVNMITGYEWLNKWSPEKHNYHSFVSFNDTWKGRLAYWLKQFNNRAWKRV